MPVCSKCHQHMTNDYCSSCAEKAREADRHHNHGNNAATPVTGDPRPENNRPPLPAGDAAGGTPAKTTPLPLDNFAAKFIYARWVPLALMALLAFEIVASLKFLQSYQHYYGYGIFTLPFPLLYAPLVILLFINLLMMFRFREFHQQKSTRRGHPTFCLFVFFWFWYMRTIGLTVGFWLLRHF